MEVLFKNHIRSKNLLDESKSYLLALSGGMDSVCLGYLLKTAGIRFDIAHVNFGLRGLESDEDALFVQELARKWDTNILLTHAKPDDMDISGFSLQMAAREFRYSWFQEILHNRDYVGLLVAHHADDQLETVFLNLMRGTGIEGVYGMTDKRGDIIRPLLPFSREQIREYMEANGYPWREDSSNEKNVYKRNFLRNKVFPLLEAEYPEALEVMDGSFKRLKDTGRAFFFLFEKWKNEVVRTEGDYQYMPIKEIETISGKSSMVYYWLRDFGFSISDVADILASISNGESGKTFYAGKYMLNKDRDYLILGLKDFEWEDRKIEYHDISIKIKDLHFDILHLNGEVEFDRSKQNAMFDLDKLKFPIVVRKWKAGDRIIPLGMDKPKKISDLLVDLKVPLIQKKQVLVLCAEEEIIWVIGYRISERFKIEPRTKNVLYFKKV